MIGKFEPQMLETIQAKATTLGCFGWVQHGKELNLVGEGRCAKGKGKVFQDWLETQPNLTRFEKLVSFCCAILFLDYVYIYSIWCRLFRCIAIQRSACISLITRFWMRQGKHVFWISHISARTCAPMLMQIGKWAPQEMWQAANWVQLAHEQEHWTLVGMTNPRNLLNGCTVNCIQSVCDCVINTYAQIIP